MRPRYTIPAITAVLAVMALILGDNFSDAGADFVGWLDPLSAQNPGAYSTFSSSPFSTPLWLFWLHVCAFISSVSPFGSNPTAVSYLVKSVPFAACVAWAILFSNRLRTSHSAALQTDSGNRSLVIACVSCVPLVYNSATMGQFIAIAVLGAGVVIALLRKRHFARAGFLFGLLLALSPATRAIVPFALIEIFRERNQCRVQKLAIQAAKFISSATIVAIAFYAGFNVSPGIFVSASKVLASAGEYNLFALFGYNLRALNETPVGAAKAWLICGCVIMGVIFAVFRGFKVSLCRRGVFVDSDERSLALGACFSLLVTTCSPGMTPGSSLIVLAFFPFLTLRTRHAVALFFLLCFFVTLEQITLNYATHFISAKRKGLGLEIYQWITPSLLFSVLVKIGVILAFLRVSEGPTADWALVLTRQTQSRFQRLCEIAERFTCCLRRQSKGPPLRWLDFLLLALVMSISFFLTFRDLGQHSMPSTSVPMGTKWSIEPVPSRSIQSLRIISSHHLSALRVNCHEGGPTQQTSFDPTESYRWVFREFDKSCESGFDLEIIGPAAGKVYELVLFDPSKSVVSSGTICHSDLCEKFADHPLFDEPQYFSGARTPSEGAIFDEFFNIIPAVKTLLFPHEARLETVHPFLGRGLIHLSIKVFGFSPWAWRFPGALAGALLPLLIFWLTWVLFLDRNIAVLAAVFSLLDTMRLGLSRMATVDIQLTFWLILSHIFLVLFVRTRLSILYEDEGISLTSQATADTGKKLKSAFFIVAVFAAQACAIATKWIGLFSLPVVCLALVIPFLARSHLLKSDSQTVVNPHKMRNTIGLGFGVAALIFLIAGIYAATYLPFLDANDHQSSLSLILRHQLAMFRTHARAVGFHPFSSPFSSWPFVDVPLEVFSDDPVSPTVVRYMFIFGHPLIWWGILPAIGILLYRKLYLKAPFVFFPILMFAAQYLPWVLIRRPVFIYHFLTASVFGAMILVTVLSQLRERWASFKWLYLACTISVFLWFLPFVISSPMTKSHFEASRWFGSWFYVVNSKTRFTTINPKE